MPVLLVLLLLLLLGRGDGTRVLVRGEGAAGSASARLIGATVREAEQAGRGTRRRGRARWVVLVEERREHVLTLSGILHLVAAGLAPPEEIPHHLLAGTPAGIGTIAQAAGGKAVTLAKHVDAIDRRGAGGLEAGGRPLDAAVELAAERLMLRRLVEVILALRHHRRLLIHEFGIGHRLDRCRG
jgi:hypothetical protein